jgi:hypothetical protein
MSDSLSIQSIQMSIHSAELHMIGFRSQYEIHLNCGLVNIARGSSNTVIHRGRADDISFSGRIFIPLERPVMQTEITLPAIQFDQIKSELSLQSSRSAMLVAMLEDPLTVTLEGDLQIQADQYCKITDISWMVPLG